MRILIIGATGIIGRAVASALSKHDLILASHTRSKEMVDISDAGSIKGLFARVGRIDAVVSAAGQAKFAPLESLTDRDFDFCYRNKLMGQVNLVRFGLAAMRDGGSFTLTSGTLAQRPIVGGSAISLVNAALEGFARGAALEMPRKIRVNVVSPPWVSETLKAMGQDPDGGLPASVVAIAYVDVVEGKETGQVVVPR